MKKLEMLPLRACPGAADEGCLTRRAILATLASAALTACSGTTTTTTTAPSTDSDAGTGDDGGSGDDGGGMVTCPSSSERAGALSSFPQGKWKGFDSYIVGHDAKGLFAFSTTCTHQGCTIGSPDPSTGDTVCPCHGASFDGNGAVTQGPARSPLPHFALTVCNGEVYVDTSKTVSSSTRTPPM